MISLAYLLKLEGHTVLSAHDGQKASNTIEREKPDLVLPDVMMSITTGFEADQAVRANDALQATRILMLTAKGRDTDLSQGLALGADAYMTKPFSTRELAQKVADMLVDLPASDPEMQAFSGVIEALAAQRDDLRNDVAQPVALASLGVNRSATGWRP